ncbi:MAG: metallophosphoesterase, partial [Longimicrobiales bacterium]|nr:metallophosphoesterase [Longimicrobiales bacterium]
MRRSILAATLLVVVAGCVSNASYVAMESLPQPPERLQARLYLIGDAGLDSPGRDAVLSHARADLLRHVEQHPDVPALMVFLGDNIYDVGARRAFRSEDLAKLAAQVRAVAAAPNVRGIFLPGNHDWGHGAPDPEGRTAIEIQQRWIEEIEGAKNVGFLPADECPGPVTVDVQDDVHVVFIDTEWLLRLPDGCGGQDLFYERLTQELRRLQGGRVVLVAHHPMATGGPHGGNVGIMQMVPLLYYVA